MASSCMLTSKSRATPLDRCSNSAQSGHSTSAVLNLSYRRVQLSSGTVHCDGSMSQAGHVQSKHEAVPLKSTGRCICWVLMKLQAALSFAQNMLIKQHTLSRSSPPEQHLLSGPRRLMMASMWPLTCLGPTFRKPSNTSLASLCTFMYTSASRWLKLTA